MLTTSRNPEQKYLCFGNDPMDGSLYDHEVRALSADHARRRHFDIYGYYAARIKVIEATRVYQRKTVTLPAQVLTHRTGKRWKGLHQGWVVYAIGISACTVGGEVYQDNELVDILFDRPVEKGTRRPTRRLDQAVRLTSVTNPIELD